MRIKIIFQVARYLAAIIMLQTLYFKFTGAPESIYIFSTVGMEPWGRYLVGFSELLASGLLIVSVAAGVGALLTIVLMVGAIGMHLTVLGLEVQGDGGYLFFLAVLVLICAVYVAYYQKEELQSQLKNLIGK